MSMNRISNKKSKVQLINRRRLCSCRQAQFYLVQKRQREMKSFWTLNSEQSVRTILLRILFLSLTLSMEKISRNHHYIKVGKRISTFQWKTRMLLQKITQFCCRSKSKKKYPKNQLNRIRYWVFVARVKQAFHRI